MKTTLLYLSALIIIFMLVFMGNILITDRGGSNVPDSVDFTSITTPHGNTANQRSNGSKESLVKNAARVVPAIPNPQSMPPIARDLYVSVQTGNVHAACELSNLLHRCALARLTGKAADFIENASVMGRGTGSDPAALLDKLRANSNASSNSCLGYTDPQVDAAFDLQLFGEGTRDYDRWITMSPRLDRNNFLAHLEKWRAYKVVAERYEKAASAAPDRRDLLPLALIYLPDGIPYPRPAYQLRNNARFLALVRMARAHDIRLPEPVAGAERWLLEGGAGPIDINEVNEQYAQFGKLNFSFEPDSTAVDHPLTPCHP